MITTLDCSLLGAIGMHYAHLRLGLGLGLVLGLGVAKQSACIALYYRNTWNVVERTAYI